MDLASGPAADGATICIEVGNALHFPVKRGELLLKLQLAICVLEGWCQEMRLLLLFLGNNTTLVVFLLPCYRVCRRIPCQRSAGPPLMVPANVSAAITNLLGELRDIFGSICIFGFPRGRCL